MFCCLAMSPPAVEEENYHSLVLEVSPKNTTITRLLEESLSELAPDRLEHMDPALMLFLGPPSPLQQITEKICSLYLEFYYISVSSPMLSVFSNQLGFSQDQWHSPRHKRTIYIQKLFLTSTITQM